MMRTAALIIARGGSKRLPGKNLLDFEGKPVLAWNLVKAKRIFPEVYFSSESRVMLRLAEKYGAKIVIRPPELALDEVPNIPVFVHAYQFMNNPDLVVSLQANSPTLPEARIKTALAIMNVPGIEELITIDRDLHVHGSIWALKRERLLNYGNPFAYKAEIFMFDDTVDIHTKEDFENARIQYAKNSVSR